MIGEGMTDREALLALLERFQIEPHAQVHVLPWRDSRTVTLAAKHGGVDGYAGSSADFEFGPHGDFQTLSIGE